MPISRVYPSNGLPDRLCRMTNASSVLDPSSRAIRPPVKRSKTLKEQRTVKDEYEIVRLSRDHSQKQISEIMGLSKTTVQGVQRKYHVTLSFGQTISSNAFREDHKWDKEKWADAIDFLYYERKLTLQATAELMGTTAATLRKRMDELGYEPRTTGQAQKGTKRTTYKWKAWPKCDTSDCTTRVKSEYDHCFRCRLKIKRGELQEAA